MHDFTLPANIKQIGSIGTGLRIYMEDYVCTFLHQYATSGGYDERLAYLVGRHMVIDGQSFLFISGAMYGMYAEQVEGYSRFTQKSAEYASAMLDEHFPGLEIVGWMQSQPSYGTYLNQHYGAYHLRQFIKPYHVMFVMDPLERVNAFYTVNPNAITPVDRMAEIGGYFIYYEKNVNMHEYMLTNKTVDYSAKAVPPTFVEITPVDTTEDFEEPEIFLNNEIEENDNNEETTSRFTYGHDHAPEDIIRRHKSSTAKRRGEKADQKRASGLLAGLCAVLFVVSFVMGVGLVRNQDDIRRMEAQIQQLVTAHRNLFAQLYSPAPAPAFAETHEPEIADVVEYTPEYVPAPVAQVIPEPPPLVVVAEPPPPLVAAEPSPQVEVVPVYYEQEVLIPPIPESYTIQPGDSLLAISLYFFGDMGMVDAILELNGIDDPNMIVAGRTLLLPQR